MKINKNNKIMEIILQIKKNKQRIIAACIKIYLFLI